MSKSKKTKKLTKNFGDITLNDFANSTVCKSRPKKSSNNVTHVIKKLEEDKLWDEKLDDLEGDFVETQDEDGNVTYVLKKAEIKKRKKASSCSVEENDISGYDYPMDVWFLISEWIQPEDVGRFAGICKTSFAVTNTAKFWFNLYKRYYKSVPNLPERLQPECMLRLYGVRTSVVRSLYYMYNPFVERLKTTMPFDKHPDCLNKHQCVSMSNKKMNLYWNYWFKLKENNIPLPRNTNFKKPDLIEMLEDISANSEENCRILEVICNNYTNIPTIQGLTLSSVKMSLSSTVRHHKLQMVFGSGATYLTQVPIGSCSTSIVILDGVINIKILDWWHPSYPHNHNMELLLRSD